LFVVFAYDISDDRVREKVRRLLQRYGLCYISRSVYAGRISWSRVLLLCQKVSGIIGERDTAVVIPVQNVDFKRAISVVKGKVSFREDVEVIVAGEDL